MKCDFCLNQSLVHMLSLARRRFCSATSASITEAGQIADWIIEQIEHTYVDRMDGRCEAASYDISGNCWKYFNRFADKFQNKEKLVKLMEDRAAYLHIDAIDLDDFDALIVSKILRFRSASTQLLDMNNNPRVGDAGIGFVSRNVLSMKSPVQLKSLFASNCGVSDEGVESLVAPLSHPEQSLRILELRKNQVTDEGAETLAKVLSYPSVITPEFTLFLSGNSQIGERGAVALAKAVVESQGRLKVWLKDTCGELSEQDKAEIAKFTKNHIKF